MKRADVILILVAGVICAALFFWRFQLQGSGASVTVEVDGEVFGTYPLGKDQVIPINDTNVLTISDGEAYMSEAACPDKLCINMGHIRADGEMIVCLPNRVVIQVVDESTEEDENGVDVIAG